MHKERSKLIYDSDLKKVSEIHDDLFAKNTEA